MNSEQRTQLQTVINKITRTNKIACVICYGVRTESESAWSCFEEAQTSQRAEYDLLIVSSETDKTRRDAIAQALQNHATPCMKFVVVVHSFHAFREALQQRDFFFTRVYEHGTILYDATGQQHNGIDSNTNTSTNINTSPTPTHQHLAQQHLSQAQQFNEGATFFLNKQWPARCAFMLHQTVEHTCMALISLYLGYRASTHNLSKLLALTRNFSPQPSAMFTNTVDQHNLFTKLTHAYVDARYNNDYNITLEETTQLHACVQQLMQTAESLYAEKMSATTRCTTSFSPISSR